MAYYKVLNPGHELVAEDLLFDFVAESWRQERLHFNTSYDELGAPKGQRFLPRAWVRDNVRLAGLDHNEGPAELALIEWLEGDRDAVPPARAYGVHEPSQVKPATSSGSAPAKKAVPKILHCTWAGGGPLGDPAETYPKGLVKKTIAGITSWLEQTDYEVWVWWDDAHVYNMHTRAQIPVTKPARAEYDKSLDSTEPPYFKAQPGKDIHSLRFLSRDMSPEAKLALAIGLIRNSFAELAPLRDLQAKYKERLKLCNIRKHEFLTGMAWTNLEAYDTELSRRGMFAAAASDVLRYEVLYNFGGVYLDVDIQVEEGGIAAPLVEPDGLLAGITYDTGASNAPYTGTAWQGRDTLGRPSGPPRCLYMSNCIVACHPGSRAVDAVRESIARCYGALSGKVATSTTSVPVEPLRTYWLKNITRATLDLTGPNIVRDVLWLHSQGIAWAEIPAETLRRLLSALADTPQLVNKLAVDEGKLPIHSRVAYLWRDDAPEHQDFWRWVAGHAGFPMARIKFDTEDARNSDCQQAGVQNTGALSAEGPSAYFPRVKVDDILKGTRESLRADHRQLRPVPARLDIGSEIEWGGVLWKVEPPEPSASGSIPPKGKVWLRRLC